MTSLIRQLIGHFSKWEPGYAVVSVGYRRAHSYKARRHKLSGHVQIYVREWMPAPTDDSIEVTFIPLTYK